MHFHRLLIASALALGVGCGAVRADDRYYLIMFAAQARPNVIEASHTFAIFSKVTGDPSNPKIETALINWMPESLKIEPLNREPEPGINLSIERTITWAKAHNSQISMWGPYPIKKGLFDMAVAQADKLNSGKVQYVLANSKLRGKGASNCIHAVSDLDKTQPLLNTGTAYGEEASKMVLSHFDPYILPTKKSNRWLVDRLGISPDAIRFINPDLTAP